MVDLSKQPQTVIAIYRFLLCDKLRKYWFACKVHIHQYHRVRVGLAGCCWRYRYWFNITAFVPRGPCNDWQPQFHFNHTLRCSCLYLIANFWNITSSKLISARFGGFELLSCRVLGLFQGKCNHWWYVMALFWHSGEDEESHGQRLVQERTGGGFSRRQPCFKLQIAGCDLLPTGDTRFTCAQFN